MLRVANNNNRVANNNNRNWKKHVEEESMKAYFSR